MDKAPVIAIVGRPNVGKSTLFNRLVGRRRAIVHKSSGITRDRIEDDFEWEGKRYHLIDLAGIDRHDVPVVLDPFGVLEIAIDVVVVAYVRIVITVQSQRGELTGSR